MKTAIAVTTLSLLASSHARAVVDSSNCETTEALPTSTLSIRSNGGSIYTHTATYEKYYPGYGETKTFSLLETLTITGGVATKTNGAVSDSTQPAVVSKPTATQTSATGPTVIPVAGVSITTAPTAVVGILGVLAFFAAKMV